MRDAKHFRSLLDRNPNAAVGFALAASAVYASRFGACEAADHSTEEWKTIARELKTKYGESLTADEVKAEMCPKRGAPIRDGVLIRVPCRFNTREEYERVLASLDIYERGAVLSRESEK